VVVAWWRYEALIMARAYWLQHVVSLLNKKEIQEKEKEKARSVERVAASESPNPYEGWTVNP